MTLAASTCRLAWFAILAVAPVWAVPVPLLKLSPASGAIVVGTALNLAPSGSVVWFHLTVERVFLGDSTPGDVIPVTWDVTSSFYPNSPSPDAAYLLSLSTPPTSVFRGVWFLRKSAEGWQCNTAINNMATAFNNAFYPVRKGALPAELRYPDSAALADKLFLEIAAAEDLLPSDISGMANGIQSPAALQALRYLAQHGNSEQKLEGITSLLSRGDAAALPLLEALGPALPSTPGAGHVAAALGSSYRQTDAASIGCLGRLATSPATAQRLARAAALALYSVHTAESLPYLARLLDSKDPQLQQYGVQGLGLFANGIGVVTAGSVSGMGALNSGKRTAYTTAETARYLGFDAMRRDEYVTFWRGWWTQHAELHSR